MSLVFHCLQGRFGSEPLDISSSFPPVLMFFWLMQNFQALCAHPEASPSRTCDTGHQSAAQNPVNCLGSSANVRSQRQLRVIQVVPGGMGGSQKSWVDLPCFLMTPQPSECWQEVAVTHTFCTERQWRGGWETWQRILAMDPFDPLDPSESCGVRLQQWIQHASRKRHGLRVR